MSNTTKRQSTVSGGKPYTKFTAKKKDEYLAQLRSGLRRGAAAQAVGVCRHTIRYHARQDPDFDAAIVDAEQDAIEAVEDALFQTALGGNVTAIIFLLTNRKPDRWQDRRNLHHAVAKEPELSEAGKRLKEQLLAEAEERDHD